MGVFSRAPPRVEEFPPLGKKSLAGGRANRRHVEVERLTVRRDWWNMVWTIVKIYWPKTTYPNLPAEKTYGFIELGISIRTVLTVLH